MWETISILAAVVIGAAALLLIIRRQAKRGAPGCCSDCRYGARPSEREPPTGAADVPDGCEKLK